VEKLGGQLAGVVPSRIFFRGSARPLLIIGPPPRDVFELFVALEAGNFVFEGQWMQRASSSNRNLR
jgi:hypothetical protein